MIIFLDVKRYINDVYWVDYPRLDTLICRNKNEFVEVVTNILKSGMQVSNLLFSFDHDLQDFYTQPYSDRLYENTGYDCAKWLIEYLFDSGYNISELNYVVHSQNNIGKTNIICFIDNAKKYIG